MSEMDPIRRALRLNCPIERAFRVFTEEMGTWWPLDTHSIAVDQGLGQKAKTLRVDTRPGGRIEEVLEDGSTRDWAGIVAWEPPHRVIFAWKPHDRPIPPTEVEVSFNPGGDFTLLEVEHRGWDRLGELSHEIRPLYASEGGWTMVLERYRNAAETHSGA